MKLVDRFKAFLNGPKGILASPSSWDYGKDLQFQAEKSQLLLSKITTGLGKIVEVDDPKGTIGGWSSPLMQLQAQQQSLVQAQGICSHTPKAGLTNHVFPNGDKWVRCTRCGKMWKGIELLNEKFTEGLKSPSQGESVYSPGGSGGHTWGLEADLQQQEKPPVKISGLAADSIRVFREDKA